MIIVLHFVFSLLTFYYIGKVLANDIQSHIDWQDIVIVIVILSTAYAIDKLIFESEEDQNIKDIINFELLEIEHKMILSNISTGIVTVKGCEDDEEIYFSNKYASNLFVLD